MAQAMKTYNIEALNGENYYNWKFRIQMILAENNVGDHVEHELDTEGLTVAEKDALMKQEHKAKSIIVQCVADSQLEHLRGKKTSHEMWKTLEDKFERKGLPGQLFLKKKMLQMKLREGENLENFILQFEELIRQLNATGVNITEDEKICNLLMALPKSYETIVTVIENLPASELKYENIKKKLMSENEKRCLNKAPNIDTPSTSQTAFMANEKRCFTCGKKNHISKDCWHKKDGKDGNRGKMYRNNFGNRGNNRPKYQQKFTNNSSNLVQQDQQVVQEDPICFLGEENGGNQETSLIFFMDSGCTDHLVNDKKVFTNLKMLDKPVRIAIAKSNIFLNAIGVGNINVFSPIDNTNKIKCTLQNVLYVPDLRRNLLSVKKLEISGLRIVFEEGKVKMYKANKIIGVGNRENLYEIKFEVILPESLQVDAENNFMLWHQRFAHLNFTSLEKVIKGNYVLGIDNKIDFSKNFCEACISGKMSKLPFGKRTRSNKLLEIIHTDVCGPINPESFEGHKYFLTFIDDYSGFTVTYLIKQKSEVFSKFKEYFFMTKARFNQQIVKLRCDNGGEYVLKEFKDFCVEQGITIDYTVPYTPQQNGKAERKNRSIVERARSMINESGAPKQLWGEAVLAATYVLNRCPSENLGKDLTPAEIWYNRKPNVNNLRIFGTVAYSHVQKDKRNKFDSKVKKCIVVGYTNNGYRLWNIAENKIEIARDVKINENCFWYKSNSVEVKVLEEVEEESIDEIQDEHHTNGIDDENDSKEETQLDNNKHGKRQIRPPAWHNNYEMYMAFDAVSYLEKVPETVQDIKGRNDEFYWRKAMEREIQSIEKNETWIEASIPENAEILSTKWVFALKPHEEKNENKYKARLVVRGFAQCDSFDFNEIYSPVAKMTTIRMLLSIGNQFKYYFKQLDVETAFLNGDLKEDIYIYPPEGVTCKSNMVFKLKKALYGLKQSSKCWNKKINDYILNLGFERSNNDYCLYIKHEKNTYLYLLLYVDDIIISGSDLKTIDNCVHDLKKEFNIKDKGNLKHFLGLEINYNREIGILKISQKDYIQSILRKFKFENCNPHSTPIDPKLKLKENEQPNNLPVRELVGCLMYLMLGSRPDISFSVNYFSRYQDKNSIEVWTSLKRLLRYLKGTIDFELIYKRQNVFSITCYVDSDWAGDLHDRKSISGYLIKLFGNCITWVTKKQNCITLSTTEAELVALCSAVQDCLWIKKILNDMKIQHNTLKIYEDNQGCISILQNPENNRRVKHIDVKYNFISENIKKGFFEIKYVNTKLQQADILTKGLYKEQFYELLELIGLVSERC